jgi:hypothetical protein
MLWRGNRPRITSASSKAQTPAVAKARVFARGSLMSTPETCGLALLRKTAGHPMPAMQKAARAERLVVLILLPAPSRMLSPRPRGCVGKARARAEALAADDFWLCSFNRSRRRRMTCASLRPIRHFCEGAACGLGYFLKDGVCDPLAVKAKPWRAKNAAVLSPGTRPGWDKRARGRTSAVEKVTASSRCATRRR